MANITARIPLEIPLPIRREGAGAGDENRTRVLSLGSCSLIIAAETIRAGQSNFLCSSIQFQLAPGNTRAIFSTTATDLGVVRAFPSRDIMTVRKIVLRPLARRRLLATGGGRYVRREGRHGSQACARNGMRRSAA